MKIGLKIKQLANDKKVSVIQLAQLLGVSRQNIYNIFDRDTVDIDTLRQISDFLGVPISSFLEVDGVDLENNDIEIVKNDKIILSNTNTGNIDFVKQTLNEKDNQIVLLKEQTNSLQKQNDFLQQQIQFFQSLLAGKLNELGEMKGLLLTVARNNGLDIPPFTVGKAKDNEIIGSYGVVLPFRVDKAS